MVLIVEILGNQPRHQNTGLSRVRGSGGVVVMEDLAWYGEEEQNADNCIV